MPTNRATAIVAVAAVAAAAVWAAAIAPRRPTLTVTFLDVGEGLSVVALTPSGKAIVIDCGTSSWRKPEDVGEKVTAAYLQTLGVDEIDLAILSHPHSDHVSGFAGLLKRKKPHVVLDLGLPPHSRQYRAFLSAAKRAHATYRVARRGQTISMGDGVFVHVLAPDPGHAGLGLNDRCIVLRLTFGQTAVLIAADAGEELEKIILSSHSRVRSQALLVGHHGSALGTSPAWLAAVRPSVAVISCGRRNEYGHPSREVLSRLSAFGARIYRTDRNGAVSITTDGQRLKVRCYRKTP